MFTDDTLHYFFSSCAQTVGALVGLSGAFSVFRYQLLVQQVDRLSETIINGIAELSDKILDLDKALTKMEKAFLENKMFNHEKVDFWSNWLRPVDSGTHEEVDQLRMFGVVERELTSKQRQMLKDRHSQRLVVRANNGSSIAEYQRLKQQIESIRVNSINAAIVGIILIGLAIVGIMTPSFHLSKCMRTVSILVYTISFFYYLLLLVKNVKTCFSSYWTTHHKE